MGRRPPAASQNDLIGAHRWPAARQPLARRAAVTRWRARSRA